MTANARFIVVCALRVSADRRVVVSADRHVGVSADRHVGVSASKEES